MNRRAMFSLVGVTAVAAQSPALAASSSSSTLKANAQIAKSFIANVLTQNNVNALDGMIDPNIAANNSNDAPGADAFKARLSNWLQFIDFSAKNPKFSADTVVAQGNDVIVRGGIKGTSDQGKAINATYFVQLTIKNGVIVAAWYAYDSNALMGL